MHPTGHHRELIGPCIECRYLRFPDPDDDRNSEYAMCIAHGYTAIADEAVFFGDFAKCAHFVADPPDHIKVWERNLG